MNVFDGYAVCIERSDESAIVAIFTVRSDALAYAKALGPEAEGRRVIVRLCSVRCVVAGRP